MITGLTKWKVGVYLAAIFAAGGISGYFVAGKVPDVRTGETD